MWQGSSGKYLKIRSVYPIFTGLSDQGQLVFVDRDGNRYPLFHDKSSTTATYMEKTFVDLLKARRDPRLFGLDLRKKELLTLRTARIPDKLFIIWRSWMQEHMSVITWRNFSERGEGSPLNPGIILIL